MLCQSYTIPWWHDTGPQAQGGSPCLSQAEVDVFIHFPSKLGNNIPKGIQVGYLGTKYILPWLHCVTAVLPPTDDQGQLPLTNCWFFCCLWVPCIKSEVLRYWAVRCQRGHRTISQIESNNQAFIHWLDSVSKGKSSHWLPNIPFLPNRRAPGENQVHQCRWGNCLTVKESWTKHPCNFCNQGLQNSRGRRSRHTKLQSEWRKVSCQDLLIRRWRKSVSVEVPD